MWSLDDVKSQSTKTWFHVGTFPFDGRAPTNGYLVDKTPCYTLLDTGTSKAMLSKRFYDEHHILHQYPKYPKTINYSGCKCPADYSQRDYEISDFLWK